MIAVSAGHYPERPGACYNGFCEHEEAVKWMKEILKYLGADGIEVPVGTLKEKVSFINSNNSTIAIEIHFNSFKTWKDANRDGIITDDELIHAGDGCETLFYPGSQKGAYLAGEVQKALAPSLFEDRGIKPGWYRMNPDNGPDFFLSKTRCVSIIAEPQFIHHKDEIQSKREMSCEMIAMQLINCYEEFK